MAGIPSISGVAGLSAAQFAAEYTVKSASLVQDAVQQQGQAAIKLIEAAAIDGTGQNLDISI